jgi:surfactin synthase thioesterase subunit
MARAMNSEAEPDYLISLSRYVEDPDFLRRILPGMRADYPMLLTYEHRVGAPLDCDITAFSAAYDEMVYPDEIEPWGTHSAGAFVHRTVEGDHWFLNRNREIIAQEIEAIAASFPDSMATSGHALFEEPFAQVAQSTAAAPQPRI